MSPMLIGAGVAFFAGTFLGWMLRAVHVAKLTERLNQYEKLIDFEKSTIEKLEKEFKLAASEALKASAEQFLSSAIKDLRQVKTEADNHLDQKKYEITSSVSDMKAKLEEYQKAVRKFEEERVFLHSRLEHSLSQVLSAEQSIRSETGALKRVLTASTGVRGRWGERVFQEILEQNDLLRGANFETQVNLSDDEDNDCRPDFVIYLPGRKRLIVDAKEVTGEYLLAQETDDAEKQKEHYKNLVTNIRENFIRLSRKEYQNLLDREVPFVVMFIPSEAAIRAAFATDPGLFEEANRRRVILASPMTVVPLIYLVAHGWQQQKLADNARELGEVVEELGNRMYKFVSHLQDLRQGLKKAADGWNSVMGSWQSKVLPQIEKTKALGGKLKEAEELSSLETELRVITEQETHV